jgi:hypothetical protein
MTPSLAPPKNGAPYEGSFPRKPRYPPSTHRVHVSPRSIMVPVPPFQHSPMFGHCASSHTVCKSSSRKLSRNSSNRVCEPPGAGTWNQSGRRPSGIGPPTLGMTGGRGSVVDIVIVFSEIVGRWSPQEVRRRREGANASIDPGSKIQRGITLRKNVKKRD